MDANGRLISQDPHLLRVVKELSDMLNCQLDSEQLKILVELLELGISPQALALTVRDLREQKNLSEARELKKEKQKTSTEKQLQEDFT